MDRAHLREKSRMSTCHFFHNEIRTSTTTAVTHASRKNIFYMENALILYRKKISFSNETYCLNICILILLSQYYIIIIIINNVCCQFHDMMK